MGIIRAIVIYTALMAAASAPVVIVAYRQGRTKTVKRFVAAALGLGLLCGLMSGVSQRLIDQCLAEGNSRCFDAGAGGMLALIVGGFLGTSIIKAYLFATD